MQLDTIRDRAGRVRADGVGRWRGHPRLGPVADPWVLLGYSAYWASGIGFEQMQAAAQALARLHVAQPLAVRRAVGDGRTQTWPQRVLAAFTPGPGRRQNYAATGGAPTTLHAATLAGETVQLPALALADGARERFEVDVPRDTDLVLRKQYVLDADGQRAEVRVNGQACGTWDLRPSGKSLSGGLREAVYVIDRKYLASKPRATIEVAYTGRANTIAWAVLAHAGGPFPLSALGPIHASQNVGHLRVARNVIGAPLKVGKTGFENGLGVFAQSLIEYPLNGQFSRFSARVGIDAATEGRGSVVFDVVADGKKIWSSPTMSGLDEAREVKLDVKGVNRLRLIVTDAGDGNKFDAADWCEPELER